MLTESCGRSITGNHSGRDKQVPAVKDCRFTQTAFGTVVHDSSGKWLGQYETEDAAVEMLREMAKKQGVTEELKATDMMRWIGLMNNIRACADEIVLNDIVYS